MSIIFALGKINLISPICLKLFGILSIKKGLFVLKISASLIYCSPIIFSCGADKDNNISGYLEVFSCTFLRFNLCDKAKIFGNS